MEILDTEAAVSCSLNDEEFRARRALARRTFIPKIQDWERTQDTLLFTFYQSEDLRQTIEDFVNLERQCCGFLTFEIIDNDTQPAALRISGPPNAAAAIDLFAATVEAGRTGR